MPRNIEIKATVEDFRRIQGLIETLADQGPTELNQIDTFFGCRDGRLKLREFGQGTAELIFYRRPNVPGPKASEYSICPVGDPAALKEILNSANGILAIVRKRRLLYLAGRTRIHLDQVEDLGAFLELEVVLTPTQMTEDGINVAEGLMRDLEIGEDQLVDMAYVDLLLKGTSRFSS